MASSALISPCGTYRYRLGRTWDNVYGAAGNVLWIMLNPSTADAEKDDPTIRRCISFSKIWGYGACNIGNLFAYRATNPENMWKAEIDIVGEENDYHLLYMAKEASLIMCAWGLENCDRSNEVKRLLKGKHLYCLDRNKNGGPRHPLYVNSNRRPIPYV